MVPMPTRSARHASVRIAPALLLVVSIAAAAQNTTTPPGTPYDAVDPLIGTAGGGNTFPGATLPFGMIQWSPDTQPDAWYDYSKKQITGFSLTHISGAGCPLYGDIPVLPTAADLTVSPHQNPALYSQPFSHANETAHPGYYAVTLDNGTKVELTVTDRAGIAHFTFPAGVPARLLLNAGGSANSAVFDQDPANQARAKDGYKIILATSKAVEGEARAGGFCSSSTNYTLYFAAQFDHPALRTSMWHDDTVDPAAHQESARHAGAWLDFGSQRAITMKVGISFVNVDNARANLRFEIPSWNFAAVHTAAQRAWSQTLNRIDIRGGTPAQRTIFYTGLYHMLLSPNTFSDDNDKYIGFDGITHQLTDRYHDAQYANFSDWDIYRNVIQLDAVLYPDRTADMAQSLVNDAAQSGWLPRWPAANDTTYVMGGDSPTVLLADAFVFGAGHFDTRTALQQMIKAATQPGTGPHNQSERPYLAEELQHGYVPVDHDRIAVSRTLEYASDDFAIAQFARANGDTATYNALIKRAGNWQNLFDPDTHWIRPRLADGSWLPGFDADRSLPRPPNAPDYIGPTGYEEGNAWQYSFMVPYDYPLLIAAMGGSAPVIARLDRFFSKLICWNEPCFNMANEPDFVTPYVYAWTTQPWKTDDVLTRIEQQTFSTRPDGIPGNDDLGATSGVYVWNALGLYPGIPGVGGLLIGTPMFPEATVHLSGGRTLVITSEQSEPTPGDVARGEPTPDLRHPGVYVKSITLNGQSWNQLWLPLDKIAPNATTTLHFTLQSKEPTQTNLKPPPNFRP
ncbi:MAG TPA: GH92 family glycosyl hydrolase [Acidobacteriaceae bacterium]|jgi:predicted alpha-1,2-mannosidase